MKHKYKVFRFVNGKQVYEWKEETIDPVLYLNDYYNFLDTERFENAYGHGKGSKNYTYEVLKKHLEALKIIKGFVDFNVYEMQGRYYLATGNNYRGQIPISKEEYDLLREVLL
ncbi:MAG: hypothetical protein K5765_06630 [Clostridia bacterium]|nr:hypothetical protein [Clostridia bacterium]